MPNKIQDKAEGAKGLKTYSVKNKIQDRAAGKVSTGISPSQERSRDGVWGPKGVAGKKSGVKNKIQDKGRDSVRPSGIVLASGRSVKVAGTSKNKIQDKDVQVLSSDDGEDKEDLLEEWRDEFDEDVSRQTRDLEAFTARFGSAVKPPTLLEPPPPVAPLLDRSERERLASYVDRMQAKGVVNRSRILREMVRETREKRKIAERVYVEAQANYLALHGQLALLEEMRAFWCDEKEEADARKAGEDSGEDESWEVTKGKVGFKE